MSEMCRGCGETVESINPQTKRGPCCHELPQPWHRGRDGLYNQPTPRESEPEELDHEEEEEEEDTTLRCVCGSNRWRVIFSGEYLTETNPGEEYVYYESDYETHAVCRNCGRECEHQLDLA